MFDKTTDTLTDSLLEARPKDLAGFLKENEKELAERDRPFAAYFREVLRGKGLTRQELFLKADIPEGYGYKLIAEEKHTRQRDVILRLCLAGRLTLTETQRAMKLYGMAPLYPRQSRDAVLIIAVNSGVGDVWQTDALLRENGQAPLYACRAED